jgi:acyl carrier protein
MHVGREAIFIFLCERFRTSIRGELGADDPLFSSGIIDSFGVLELIAFLEDSFGISIDTTKHELTEFDTINKIVDFVRRVS